MASGLSSSIQNVLLLYNGQLVAAPHVHQYDPLMEVDCRQIFKHTFSGIFIDVEFETALVGEPVILYRPHAYLGFKGQITPESYQASKSWVEWNVVKADVLFDDSTQKQLEGNVIIHGLKPHAVASPDNLKIGKFSDLLKKGPFISHMTIPYDVKTLHILVADINDIPKDGRALLTYLSQLPLEQQKFIIKQLFPFLTV